MSVLLHHRSKSETETEAEAEIEIETGTGTGNWTIVNRDNLKEDIKADRKTNTNTNTSSESTIKENMENNIGPHDVPIPTPPGLYTAPTPGASPPASPTEPTPIQTRTVYRPASPPRRRDPDVWDDVDDFIPGTPPGCRHIRAPQRHRGEDFEIVNINSSTDLLAKVGCHDGVVKFPYRARSNVYVTTYPFGDRDVKKWMWLLAGGIEDVYLSKQDLACALEHGREDAWSSRRECRRARSPDCCRPEYDIPSVFLSRALDRNVVPEGGEVKVRFLIVVQNKERSEKAKLMVVESREAAGIVLFYEGMNDASVVFVGAVVGETKGKKMKRVETLEEAAKVQKEDGVVGVVC